MGIKKTLLLGLGAMIFGGCYSGVEDAGEGGISDRYGKHCYYSYSSNRSASYKSSAVPNGGGSASSARTEEGFTLTMKADPSSKSQEELLEVLDQLRFQAASTAQFFIQSSCASEKDFGQVLDSCKDTCAQQGLAMDDVVLCDTECKLVDNGTESGGIECFGSLPKGAEEALSQPWYGETEWVYQTGEGTTLVMTAPELEEGKDGLSWVSQVHVTSFCLCACTAG